MDLKLRLQRMLQILEESERVGAMSDLERDIILNDLREAYAELKYSDESRVCETNTPTTPIAPIPPIEEVKSEPESEPAEEHEQEVDGENEPEVEVELIFDEESEETENEEQESEGEQNEEQSEIAHISPITPNTPIVEDNLSSLASRLSSNKRSPLLSLYEDAPTPVVGEQFHEKPSVADTIACPKGVAESAPIVSLHDAIGVADRFMLIRELFDDDVASYESAIEALDKQPSFDDCIIFIAERYAWSPNSQATRLVMDLLQRKYK